MRHIRARHFLHDNSSDKEHDDKTKTRWGKFKPWVLIGGAIAAISLALLFTDLVGLAADNPMTYLVAFTVLYLVMDIFYSAKDIAIWSMIPALSFDSREREITATYARIGSTFGAQLVTVIVMPLVLYFSINENGGAGDPRGWFAFAAIGGAMSLLGAIIPWRYQRHNRLAGSCAVSDSHAQI